MKGFGIIIPGEKMGWIEKDIPEPGRYEALARPVAIAPCTSDVHLLEIRRCPGTGFWDMKWSRRLLRRAKACHM